MKGKKPIEPIKFSNHKKNPFDHNKVIITIFIIVISLFLIQFQIIFTTEKICQTSNLESSNILDYESIQSVDSFRNIRSNSFDDTKIRFNNQTEYLIITPKVFIENLLPLANWKNQKGIITNIIPLDGPEGINTTYLGHDLPSKIHAFLREYYSYADTLKWLLLVGDSEIIPPRLLKVNVSDNTEQVEIVDYCYSDYYYSALDSTWDNNSNQKYGEPGEEDWTPELYVGRLPVNTKEEVKIVVEKILNYERNPPAGDWFSHTIQCGALMDRPNVIDNLATAVDEGYNDYKDNAYKVIKKIWNILPPEISNDTFLDYAKIPGGNYSKAEDTLNETNVLSAINKGASTVNCVSKGDNYGIRHYNGNGLGPIEYSSDYFLSYSTVEATENGNKLPFVYTSSCTSVNFTNTDDTNLESLLTSPYGGGIGVIGATTDTFRLEFIINYSSYGNWWLDFEFWNRFYNGSENYRPGAILYELKKDYNNYFKGPDNPHSGGVYESLFRTNFFAYNLLGDPEIPIYTNNPKNMKVEFPKTFSPLYRNSNLEFRVFDESGLSAISDAKICVRSKGQYLVESTDFNGRASFDLEIEDLEILNFTITAHNYYNYSGSIKIKPVEDIKIIEPGIQFEQNPITPGSTVNFSITVKNDGSSEIPKILIHSYFDEIIDKYLINSSIVYNFSVSETRIINFSWRSVVDDHEIIVVIDPKNQIFEIDEENNIGVTFLLQNKPPIFADLPPIRIFEDTPAINVLDLSQYAWDEDTNKLSYSINNTNLSVMNLTLEDSELSIYPQQDYFGQTTITIRVFDGTSVVSTNLKINTIAVNDPPIFNDTVDWLLSSNNITLDPKTNTFTVFEDQLVDIMMMTFDVDDDLKNLTFDAKSDLLNIIINSTSGRFMFIPDNNAVGTQIINLSVYDDDTENNCSWQLFKFNVINVNDPPTLNFQKHAYVVEVGEQLVLKAYASDIDVDDNLLFSDNTKIFDIDPSTGNISFIPKFDQIGLHDISITVTDGKVNITKKIIINIESPPENELDPLIIIVCPIIIVVIMVLIITQEYLKNKKRNEIKDDIKTKNEKKDSKLVKNDSENDNEYKSDQAEFEDVELDYKYNETNGTHVKPKEECLQSNSKRNNKSKKSKNKMKRKRNRKK
jgi:hypothetical protein